MEDDTHDDEETIGVSVSLSKELASRLERYEEYLQRLNPAVPVTRGAAVRALIHRALSEFEEHHASNPERERRRARLRRVPYRRS